MILILTMMSTAMWRAAMVVSGVLWSQTGAAQDLGYVLRSLAGGRVPIEAIRLETQCQDGGRFVHAVAHGNGVVIWNHERQATLTREQVVLLVKAFDREGFASMPASFGGDDPHPRRMAVKMTCRVRFSRNGAAKDVIQLEKGEQSAALKRLARSLVEAARTATKDAPTLASLEDGLAAVAAGRLAVETMRITMRVGVRGGVRQPDRRGWVLRIEGRDLEIEPDAGQPVTRRLDESTVQDVARALAEHEFAALPINLGTTEYVDVTVAVLGQEHAVQARQFADRSAPDPHTQMRFERSIAPLRALREP